MAGVNVGQLQPLKLDAEQVGQSLKWKKCFFHTVTNAINVLQAFIYKSVKTGLFFKSITAPLVAKFNTLMPVSTLKYQVL